jgi:hypothetical protein
MSLAIAAPAVAALFVFYVARSDFGRYSLGSFGVDKRVSRRSVRNEGHECADCGCEIEHGERRRFYKALVVAGSVLVRYGGGERRYCWDHADVMGRVRLQPVDEFEPVWKRLLLGFAEFVTLLPDAPPTAVSEEDSPFENVQSNMNDAFSLVGVAFLVVFVAIVVGALNGIRGDGG